MRGLAMTGSGEGWAVGDQGEIWRAQGGAWSHVASNTLINLRAVAMDSPGHGWAVGGYNNRPGLLEYSGNWEDRSNLLPPSSPYSGLSAIALAPGGGEGWAVSGPNGDPSTAWIFHLHAGMWTQDAQINRTWLASVAIDALGEAWASGYEQLRGGVVYHYRGGTWHKEDAPSNQAILGLALVPGRGGLAVGWNGTILRYQPLAQGQRFYDVPPTDTFYAYVEHLASRGIVSGYWDNTFRPYNLTTRAQTAKIAVLAEGWTLYTPPTPTFRDVPATDTFYPYIETAYSHGIITGYGCGTGCLEYRPGNNVTRGQMSKIVVLAEGWPIYRPPTPTFRDVPAADPFYGYVETAYSRGIVSGYGCGTGCLEFRPGNNATRGQVCKMVDLAISQP
jgi:hypothetical protein